MIRVVLDTNVIVSAILSPEGPSARIIRHVLDDDVSFAISPHILDEVYRVIRYPKLVKLLQRHGLGTEEVDCIIGKLGEIALITQYEPALDVILEDPADNKFLSCAVECEADYIVSGDRHLADMKEYLGIAIVDPATFLSILENKEG